MGAVFSQFEKIYLVVSKLLRYFTLTINNDMNTVIAKYSNEINSIAAHARAINFDINSGNIDELMRSWLNAGRLFSNRVEDNKTDVIRLMKTLTK